MEIVNHMEVEMLALIVSDHSPIQVTITDRFNRGLKPFRVHGFLMNNQNFL